MKFRNFIIVLLAVLMAFAFASCKNEPKEEPKPTPKPLTGDIYQIEVTEGVDQDYYNRDKIKLVWNLAIKEGDTLSLKYRSERAVYQWDIRNDSHKWVYETDKNGFVDPVLGEDGWYTLEYTFGKTYDGLAGASSAFGVYFRGNFVTTDIFEIKDILLNGEELEVETANIISKAQLNDPAEEFDWTVKNYAVLFATGKPGAVDKTPIAEKVVAGGKVTGAPISKDGFTLTIYTDEAHTAIFDPNEPINEEKIFYYEYVGVPRTVTFVTNSDSVIEPVTVPNSDSLKYAHTYDEAGHYAVYAEGEHAGEKIIVDLVPANPEKEGKAFAAWCSDEGLTTDFDLTSAITADTTLYAKYGTPRTVTFNLNGGTFGEGVANTAVVADGYPVAMPAVVPTNGSKMFLGWFTDDGTFEAAYNFATPVEADLNLYAAWVNATDVTLNLNYEGAPAATTFKAALDVALAADNENLKVVDDRIGYVFGGWYKDAACETAYDYTEDILTAPITLYAKWTEATLYKMIATHGVAEGLYDYDKFTIQFKGEGQPVANTGDILSFRFRTTTPFTFFSIRGDKKWVYENSTATRGMTTYETKEDGWTYVTYEFAAKNTDGGTNGADLWWRFDFGSRTIVVGDILEVQDFTLNGEPLTIAAANVTQYVAPTLSIVEGGAYEWASHTVTFESNEGTAIAPATIAYGGKIEKPEDPVKAGVAFDKWCSDAGLETAFNFDTPVFEDITLYAKYGESATVTFSGADIEPVTVLKGNKVAKPADPAKAENVFGGWYQDSEYLAEFDFDAAIDDDTTIYAKWIPSWTVTLNANYGDAPATRTVYVGKGEVMTEPKGGFARLGYYFAGWYNDANCSEAHDFSAAVEANTTLYAKYTTATAGHKFTGKTEEKDRWQFRWKAANVPALAELAAGDVFTFQVKFTAVEGSSVPATYRLRTNENSHVIKETSLGTAVDGWYTVEIVVPEGILSATDNQGVQLAFFRASGSIQVGDTISIKNVTYNGVKLDMTSSTSEGLYPGMAADKEEL